MKRWATALCGLLSLLAPYGLAQPSAWRFPPTVQAGTAFSVQTSGSGPATLYVVGTGDALQRSVQLGQSIAFSSEDLRNAGHYVALLVAGTETQSAQFDVVASTQPAGLSFIAKPSRLPVNQVNGLSGVVYVLDAFRNLLVQPQRVTFELSDPSGGTQSRVATTRNGVAWVKMNSATKAGSSQFRASSGDIRVQRAVLNVPGEPCTVKMNSHGAGQRIVLETDPLRDCNGNAVPDGTIVTFTEVYGGQQTTVDVPLKRGVARTELLARSRAVISVASGVVMGNEIRVTGGQ